MWGVGRLVMLPGDCQQELEMERRQAAEFALRECQQAGVSEESLKTLAFECGVKLENQNDLKR